MRAISLIGPMGSGKSQVGRALAARLGWQFVDTDAEIEAREGKPIPAVFRDVGEARFRAVERAVVRRAAGGRHRVIATGGGAVLSPATRRALAEAGPVFYLRAPVHVLVERLSAGSTRVLLGDDPQASLERLLREREPLYAGSGLAVDAARPVEAIVAEILELMATSQRRVRVELGERSYDVVVGVGTLPLSPVELRRAGPTERVAIITHRPLARLLGGPVRAALEGSGFTVETITVPVGERAKSLRQASRIVDALGAGGFGRSDTLVALGGGVVGDLAGFVAGIYMRGVRLVQLPTTLLAQVDSSIGGKTAVNHPRAKNLVGVYHQPALVVTDVDTLRLLPLRERRAGLAETVKYGMVLDEALFALLEREAPVLLGREIPPVMEEVVHRCVTLKARIVSEDEVERGPREVLNYGHTVGHAIEAVLPGHLVHGEAVAAGMRAEGLLAVRMGLLPPAAAHRHEALLGRLGLAIKVPAAPVAALLEAMRLDKKRRDGRIRCTLPEGIGRARLGVEVPETLMQEVLNACQE